jgi:ABC-type microcin C transport system duplicated ATPase subunit YejF
VRLIEADSGNFFLGAVDRGTLSRRQLRPYQRRMQMIFQDPFASLNPRPNAVKLIAEGPMVHGTPKEKALDRAYNCWSLLAWISVREIGTRMNSLEGRGKGSPWPEHQPLSPKF